MAAIQFSPPNWHGNPGSSQLDPGLDSCSHVHSAVKPPLTRPYKGPYRVFSRHLKDFAMQLTSGVSNMVSADRLMPAFLSSKALDNGHPHNQACSLRPQTQTRCQVITWSLSRSLAALSAPPKAVPAVPTTTPTSRSGLTVCQPG